MDNKENDNINIDQNKSVEDVVSNMVDEANEELDMFKEIVVDSESLKDVEAELNMDQDVSVSDEEAEDEVGEEEINKAMEVVSTSKRKRDKAKEKKARLYAEDFKGKKVDDETFSRFSFVDKCKKDPVIPVCIVLILALIIGAVLYYIVPMLGMKTFGFTFGQFTDRIYTTSMYDDAMRTWNYEIKDTRYQLTPLVSSSSSEADGEKLLDLSKMLDKPGVKYFDSDISSTYDSDLLGCVSPMDDQLIYLRALSKFDDVAETPHYVTYYYATVLQTVFPALSNENAVDVATEMLSGYNGSKEFKLMGDVACRIVMGTYNGTNYVAMDLTPRENVGL